MLLTNTQASLSPPIPCTPPGSANASNPPPGSSARSHQCRCLLGGCREWFGPAQGPAEPVSTRARPAPAGAQRRLHGPGGGRGAGPDPAAGALRVCLDRQSPGVGVPCCCDRSLSGSRPPHRGEISCTLSETGRAGAVSCPLEGRRETGSELDRAVPWLACLPPLALTPHCCPAALLHWLLHEPSSLLWSCHHPGEVLRPLGECLLAAWGQARPEKEQQRWDPWRLGEQAAPHTAS